MQEVLDLEPDQIEPAPKIGTRLKTEFIKGMGKKNDEFVIILDVARVFSTEKLAVVQGVESSVEQVIPESPGQEAVAVT